MVEDDDDMLTLANKRNSMSTRCEQEIVRHISYYGPKQAGNRDPVYFGPYREMSDEQEG
jgi:hypothetical protein